MDDSRDDEVPDEEVRDEEVRDEEVRDEDKAARVLSRVQPRWDQQRTERNLTKMLERLRLRPRRGLEAARRLRLSRVAR